MNWKNDSICGRLDDLKWWADVRCRFQRDEPPKSLAEMTHTLIHHKPPTTLDSAKRTAAFQTPHASMQMKMIDFGSTGAANQETEDWKKMHQSCISYLGTDRGNVWCKGDTKKTSDCALCDGDKPFLSEIALWARRCEVPIRYHNTGDHERDRVANEPLREWAELVQYMSDDAALSGSELLEEIQRQNHWKRDDHWAPPTYHASRRVQEGIKNREMSTEKVLFAACSAITPANQFGITMQREACPQILSLDSDLQALSKIISLNSQLEDVCRVTELPCASAEQLISSHREAWKQYSKLLSTQMTDTASPTAPSRHEIRKTTKNQPEYSDLHAMVSDFIPEAEAKEEREEQEWNKSIDRLLER